MIIYSVAVLLALVVGVGLIAVVSGLRRIPGEWRSLSKQRKRRVVVALVAAVVYATVVIWLISSGFWVPLARGQEVTAEPATRAALVALEQRVAAFEAER